MKIFSQRLVAAMLLGSCRSCIRVGICVIWVLGGIVLTTPVLRAEIVDFTSDRWVLEDAEIGLHLGRESLSGLAYLDGVDFENGVIEVDVAVSGKRSYPGIVFRMHSKGSYERFYLRPHRAGLYPDALQYTPVWNGVAGWQLYHGDGFTAGAEIASGRWLHLKIEIRGRQARVYLDGAGEPALTIPDLKHGNARGTIGVLGPRDGSAWFSRFSYRTEDPPAAEPLPIPPPPPGTVTAWQISRAFPADRVDRERYPRFYGIFAAGWEAIESEPSGLVDVARYRERGTGGADCVWARTIVRAEARQRVRLSFGYSDEVSLFLNGRPVFSGRSGYRSRDPSFVGAVGLHDTVHLELERGLNEIFLMVTETFGGWGFIARADRPLSAPVKAHGSVTELWRTEPVFLTPESVLYDRARDVLYVTSFDLRFASKSEPSGFISRLDTDGTVEELRWVTGLSAPAGMAISGDRLYVAERGRLAEIDLVSGEVIRRHPIPASTFLNDVAVDGAGHIYVTDTFVTSPGDATVVYRLAGGEVEAWLEDHSISRANGLFVAGDELLVGSTGGGTLMSVGLADRRSRTVAALGAGVVDGIRVDSRGNYLVSHWQGQIYRISPSGEVVEILDTLPAARNSADFELIPERDLLIVPTFTDNRVVAYALRPEDRFESGAAGARSSVVP